MYFRQLYTLGGYANDKLEAKEETQGRKSREEERMVVIGKGEAMASDNSNNTVIFTKTIFSLHHCSNLSKVICGRKYLFF